MLLPVEKMNENFRPTEYRIELRHFEDGGSQGGRVFSTILGIFARKPMRATIDKIHRYNRGMAWRVKMTMKLSLTRRCMRSVLLGWQKRSRVV